MNDKKKQGHSTTAVHGDINHRKQNAYHALTTPIIQTATYTFDDMADLKSYMDAKMWGDAGGRVEYARYGNPTIRAVEKKIAQLEHGGDALLFASGMAAITNTLLTILPTDAHIIYTDDCYSKTRKFCSTFLKRLGITSTEVPMGDYDALEAAIQDNTRLIISESPTNPYLRVADLNRVVTIAKARRIRTMIDSTFATPVNINPLKFGIDIVVHSATKYFSGHNDVMAGAVIADSGLINSLRMAQATLGSTVSPMAAYLIDRGLKTLDLRVQQQNQSAVAIAHFMDAHPAIDRVYYPSLPSHPDHDIATAQMDGFGGVISFELAEVAGEALLDTACRFIDALNIPLIAASLGGVESLVEPPSIMSYYELDQDERLAIGIRDSLVRLAIGIEDTADLIADITQALEQL